MELRIANHVLKTYNQVTINLKYDSIADSFHFRVFFDPENATHRELFRPFAYHKCTIVHGGVLVMTGTVLSPRFGSSATREMPDISGYSKTGILQDSCVLNVDASTNIGANDISASVPPGAMQFSGTLEQIARDVTKYYGINVVVDPELSRDPQFSVPYEKVPVDVEQTVKNLLDSLCKQKNIVLSHTKGGDLLLTRAKSDALLTTTTTYVREDVLTRPGLDVFNDPGNVFTTTTTTAADRAILYDFSEPGKWVNMNLSCDGQEMHRVIQVVGQDGSGNTLDSSVVNPIVAASSKRFMRVVQTAGDDNDTPLVARALLNDELKSIVLNIEIEGWTLNGNLVTPNQMIMVRNPELHLYKKSKWFIQEVMLQGDQQKEIAILKCVLPMCFNNDPIKNPFS